MGKGIVAVLKKIFIRRADGTVINPATEDTLALVKTKTDNLDVTLSTHRDAITGSGGSAKSLKDLHDDLDTVESKLQLIIDQTDTIETKIDAINNVFATLAKAIPDTTGKELRIEDITAGDLFIGRAQDGTATSAASWEVVRYYRDTVGKIERVRYRTGVVWDNNDLGW